jgi:hypothetical protein
VQTLLEQFKKYTLEVTFLYGGHNGSSEMSSKLNVVMQLLSINFRFFFSLPITACTSKQSFSTLCRVKIYLGSSSSSVSIVSDYGLEGRGLIPDRDRGFFF